jgi:hypothetical protein
MPRRVDVPDMLPRIASGPPTTPAPPELRAVLEELRAMRDRGELTYDVFREAYPRAIDAARVIEDEEEQLAHLEELWTFGALVGCLRE